MAANEVPDVDSTQAVSGRYRPFVRRNDQASERARGAPEHVSAKRGAEIPDLDFSVETESERRLFVRRESHGGNLIVVATKRGQLTVRHHIPQPRGAIPAARRDQTARGRE